MFPLRDDITARKAPVVTVSLIAVNLGVFLMCAMMPRQQLEIFLFQYGLIPAKLFHPEIVARHYLEHFSLLVPTRYTLGQALFPLLSSMFLHGGWLHILGNMWMLWIFGDNVEDRFGHLGFLLFYIACGLISGLTHAAMSPTSPVVTIGASGAIAGVMGAYMILYPQARVFTLVWILFLIDVWAIPAPIFLFWWFAVQLASGVAALGGSDVLAGGIAWWAHIGGFAAGITFASIVGQPPRRPRRSYKRYRYYFDPRTGRFVAASPRYYD